MAELVWKTDDPNAMGVIAEYRSGGATIKIVRDEKTKPETGIPAWVTVGRELALKAYRQYKRETGHAPSETLVRTFERVMGERLEKWLEDPKKNKYEPLSIRAFELEMLEKGRNG